MNQSHGSLNDVENASLQLLWGVQGVAKELSIFHQMCEALQAVSSVALGSDISCEGAANAPFFEFLIQPVLDPPAFSSCSSLVFAYSSG